MLSAIDGFGAMSLELLLLASCCCRCFLVFGSSVPYCGCICRLLRLAIVAAVVGSHIVEGILLLFESLGLLLLAETSCHRCQLLVVIVVGGVLLLSAAALRRSLKILVYIRLTMHATTMEPQQQAQNGPATI